MNTATQPDTSWGYRATKELVAALQARKISAVELTDHVIRRGGDFDRGREAALCRPAPAARWYPG